MANEHFKRDANRVTAVGGVTNDANLDLLGFRVDASTKRLLVSAVITAGGSSGIQYAEGDVAATITGNAIMWEDTSDTLRSVSAAKPLPVNIVAGSAAGTEYIEDAVAAANPAGGVLILVREDARAGGLTTTDGDNVAARGNNKGELYVKTTDSDILLGAVTEAAPASDTASSGLNGRLQRIAQRITSLIALIPAALTGSGNFKVSLQESNASQAVTGTVTANLAAGTNNIGDVDVLTVPADPFGANADASVAAGAAGSMQAKLRLMTSQLDSIKTAVELIDNIVSGAGANITQLGGTAIDTNSGNKSAGTQRVVLATDQPANTTPLLVRENNPATAATTNVASSASNVTLLASNASRRQAMVFNDSTQVLYLKFGATALVTSYTVQIAAGGYFELPYPAYTGIIDGIWASANGNARVTEVT